MNEKIKSIINDVFTATGVKLEAGDPLVAVLLAQHRFFHETLAQQLLAHDSERRDFIESFSRQVQALMQAINTLQNSRKELLLELLTQNKQALDDTEGRLYAAISTKINRAQQQRLTDWWSGRQRWLLTTTAVCAAASLVSLLVLLVVLFR